MMVVGTLWFERVGGTRGRPGRMETHGLVRKGRRRKCGG